MRRGRQALLSSTGSIAVTDFGAGSQVAGAGGRQRRLRDIARHAAKPPRLAQLLFRLVNHFQPATVLELGTSLGLTTAYLALANSRSQVFTFEGCPNTATVARETFTKLAIKNVQLIEGNLDATLPTTLAALTQPLDFVFFRRQPSLRADTTLFRSLPGPRPRRQRVCAGRYPLVGRDGAGVGSRESAPRRGRHGRLVLCGAGIFSEETAPTGFLATVLSRLQVGNSLFDQERALRLVGIAHGQDKPRQPPGIDANGAK